MAFNNNQSLYGSLVFHVNGREITTGPGLVIRISALDQFCFFSASTSCYFMSDISFSLFQAFECKLCEVAPMPSAHCPVGAWSPRATQLFIQLTENKKLAAKVSFCNFMQVFLINNCIFLVAIYCEMNNPVYLCLGGVHVLIAK